MTDDPIDLGGAEPAVEAAERDLFRKLFRQSNDAIFVLDPVEDTIRIVNRRACELLGYDREELLDMGPSDIHPDEIDTFRAFASEVKREGTGWTDQLTCLTQEGRRIPVEISASMIEHEDRQEMLAIVRDISERINHRERIGALLRASRRLSRAESFEEIATITVEIAEDVLEQPLTAFWRYEEASDRLVPVAAIKRAEQLSTHDGADGIMALPAETFEMEVFKQGEPRFIEDYQQLDNTASDAPLRTVLMVPVGKYGVLHVGDTESVAFGSEDRDLIELLAKEAEVALDRAARERRLRERERELERQNERLEEFAGIVAHDLRNPLNVIQGRASLAKESGDPDHIEDIEQAADQMEALIDDTLQLAQQGAVIDDPTVVSVETVVRAAWKITGLENAALTVPADANIRADEDRLQELFANLFRNAADHTEGTVTVEVGMTDDGPGFYVADDGPGIPPDEREAVFETGVSTAETGTGFGLAIVKEVAEAHGWTVTVTESEAGGARFEFTDVEIVG